VSFLRKQDILIRNRRSSTKRTGNLPARGSASYGPGPQAVNSRHHQIASGLTRAARPHSIGDTHQDQSQETLRFYSAIHVFHMHNPKGSHRTRIFASIRYDTRSRAVRKKVKNNH
jgi:hypothetical protein